MYDVIEEERVFSFQICICELIKKKRNITFSCTYLKKDEKHTTKQLKIHLWNFMHIWAFNNQDGNLSYSLFIIHAILISIWSTLIILICSAIKCRILLIVENKMYMQTNKKICLKFCYNTNESTCLEKMLFYSCLSIWYMKELYGKVLQAYKSLRWTLKLKESYPQTRLSFARTCSYFCDEWNTSCIFYLSIFIPFELAVRFVIHPWLRPIYPICMCMILLRKQPMLVPLQHNSNINNQSNYNFITLSVKGY